MQGGRFPSWISETVYWSFQLSSPFHSHRSSSIGGWQHRQPLFPSSPETTNSLRRELSPFLLIASDNTTQQQLPVSFLSNASSNDARTATVEDHHARQQQQQPDRSVFGCFFFNLREVDRRWWASFSFTVVEEKERNLKVCCGLFRQLRMRNLIKEIHSMKKSRYFLWVFVFFTKIQGLFYNLGQKKDARVKAKARVAFSFSDFGPVLDVRPSCGLTMGLTTYRDVTCLSCLMV